MTKRPTRRVLLVEGVPVLDEAIKSWLRRERDLDVSSVVHADETALLEKLSSVRPAVVVMSEAGAHNVVQALWLLRHAPAQTRLRVIAVQPDDHTIRVYEKLQRIAGSREDLIALIRDDDQAASRPRFWVTRKVS